YTLSLHDALPISRRAIHLGNAVFADAHATAAFACTLVRKRKIPVVTLSYLTDPSPGEPVRHNYAGQKRFCYLGKLDPVKRVSLAVSAIAWLRAHGIDATL